MIRFVYLLLRERLSPALMERVPEPTGAMTEEGAVRAFHEEGEAGTQLHLVHHLNAVIMNALLPKGATVVDLGCGSAQYISYLARCRPDVRIYGLDLSPQMLALGRETVKRYGVSERVTLLEGDMTAFVDRLPEKLDLVSSVYALHHLPNLGDLATCAREIRRAKERTGCGVWLFDFARSKNPKTPEAFLPADPRKPSAFETEFLNSMRAAYSYDELRGALDGAGLTNLNRAHFALLRTFQAHWCAPPRPSGASYWSEVEAPPAVLAERRRFVRMFRRYPLPGLNSTGNVS